MRRLQSVGANGLGGMSRGGEGERCLVLVSWVLGPGPELDEALGGGVPDLDGACGGGVPDLDEGLGGGVPDLDLAPGGGVWRRATDDGPR